MKYYLSNRDNNRSLLDNGFDEFFRPFWAMEEHALKTDISEKDGNCIMEMDIPGIDKKDINIELSEGYLTVSAKKEEKQEVEEKGRYIRRERRSGEYSRSFYVGTGLEEKDINATFENGTLKLVFPTESQVRKNSVKSIEIK